MEDNVVSRHADRLHQQIAQLEIEQKCQWPGEDAKPQPSDTLLLKACMLCI
jgi:hypothetical protein